MCKYNESLINLVRYVSTSLDGTGLVSFCTNLMSHTTNLKDYQCVSAIRLNPLFSKKKIMNKQTVTCFFFVLLDIIGGGTEKTKPTG